ncbi:hypothetical protein BD309DRAFT_868296 [Dichomitus squalens]|uniref:Uncharacterized protein n=2 Tax=Dichomitus squalens TaxID=114155 RepID=A0A4Q9PMY8_9APHY|nr:uncharacterized protein DICSQDRAFT_107433 [Dichomitus squalens LYAD-421 SS1]EJF60388.1 hypothetical protein DICSQDRAFT_107433 [Dichomitus squalens LYAD-421 SS1]TBU41446.1 hypothetical protein BD309DRAFT_868296 [Dichomitus squalens]TBU55620.1 hypothetical protein BD310DRAFT_825407 [Dichomitus squalens]
MAITEYKYLTPEQREHFLEHGWVKIPKAVKAEYVKAFTENVFVRLGYDPEDKSTWTKEKIHMPRHREIPTREFMPKAWGAMCELLGGEDRIDPTLFESCGDSLIVNLGSDEWVDKTIEPKDLGNWHIDGDWFTHFLDSGEQGLTVIVLYNDIKPRAGGTYVAPDGIKNVVRYLYEHPEGASEMPQDPDGSRSCCSIQTCKEFVELTGEAGDVVLIHPFMPHSASKNHLRIPRFITNPPVTLKEPLNFNRPNPADYSLVELKVLRELGVDALPEWKIAAPRMRFTPRTRAAKDAMILDELERMKAHALKTGGTVDSMHINGPVPYATVVASG